jgi:hypothetical protein
MTIILWYVITMCTIECYIALNFTHRVDSYQSFGRDLSANFEAAEFFDMLNTIRASEMQGVTFKGT